MIVGFAAKIWRCPVEEQQRLIDRYPGVVTTYVKDRGAESLTEAVRKLKRDRERILVVAADFRIFGETQSEIWAAVKMLEGAHVRVVDILQPGATMSELTERGITALRSYDRWQKIPKGKRKRAASVGGTAKRAHQEAKRAEIAHPDVIRRAMKLVTWDVFEEVFGISRATARRNY